MATQSVCRTVMETSGETNPEAATRGRAAVLQTLRDRPSPDEADQVVAEVPWGLTEIWEGPRSASGRLTPDEADQVIADLPWGLTELWEGPRRASGGR